MSACGVAQAWVLLPLGQQQKGAERVSRNFQSAHTDLLKICPLLLKLTLVVTQKLASYLECWEGNKTELSPVLIKCSVK